DAWCLFRFLHFGELILLGKQFIDCFLDFRAAVIISVLRAQKRQAPDRGIGQATGLSRRRISGLARERPAAIRARYLRAAELCELLAKLPDASVQRAHARVVVGIDLAESLELRLRRNHLAGDGASGIQHGLAFLLNVERIVLA